MISVRHVLQSKMQNRPSEVWTIGPDATVYQALELLADKDIGALPVVKDGKLIGMFSERDYARKVILMGKSSQTTTVGELMSHPVFSVSPQDSIEACMKLMTEKRIRHLPVIEDSRLVGIVSIGDLMAAIIDDQQSFITSLESYITGAR